MYNIIGDIAGRFNELMVLINSMPSDSKFIFVGDLVDRGPDSKKVIEWCINNPQNIYIKGNHEDMMVRAFNGDLLSEEDHLYNGGKETLKSYGIKSVLEYPIEHIDWMDKLPLFFQDEGIFVSHAPWLWYKDLGELGVASFDVLWNRQDPVKRPGVFQIFGHNYEVKTYGNWAMCIDDTKHKQLLGMNWPSKKIYKVDYEVRSS